MTALYDSHNHLADKRLESVRDEVIAELQKLGVSRIVVNGTAEADWPIVHELANRYPMIIPSCGLHPWHVGKQSSDWQERLKSQLDAQRSGIGEIGLDRWIEGFDIEAQEAAFVWQLQLAAERNLPASIHCLRAWGRLLELLKSGPRPACGFLLHSYGGSRELIEPLAELGAYFSISGYFAHDRKQRQREVFREIPIERLLVETDAPDMLPPDEFAPFKLLQSESRTPINHPANLAAIYSFAAELRRMTLESFSAQVADNFNRLFGALSDGRRFARAST